jgi:hypothetical protein
LFPEQGDVLFMPEAYHKLYCTLNSYLGAFSHASCRRLVTSIFLRHPVLCAIFKSKNYKVIKRWQPSFRSANLYTQYRFFRSKFRGLVLFQVGCFLEMYDKDARWAENCLGLKRAAPRKGFYARCGVPMRMLKGFSRRFAGRNLLVAFQTGRMHGRVMERMAVRLDYWVGSRKA